MDSVGLDCDWTGLESGLAFAWIWLDSLGLMACCIKLIIICIKAQRTIINCVIRLDSLGIVGIRLGSCHRRFPLLAVAVYKQ